VRSHAARLGIDEHNWGDLDDVPADVRGLLRFNPVESVDDVLTQALEPPVARLVAA